MLGIQFGEQNITGWPENMQGMQKWISLNSYYKI